MNEREAKAFRKLQNENTELKKQLASFQHTKEKTGARESPPPTKEQFNKMGYYKRVEFKQQYPELYNEYSKQWR